MPVCVDMNKTKSIVLAAVFIAALTITHAQRMNDSVRAMYQACSLYVKKYNSPKDLRAYHRHLVMIHGKTLLKWINALKNQQASAGMLVSPEIYMEIQQLTSIIEGARQGTISTEKLEQIHNTMHQNIHWLVNNYGFSLDDDE